MDAPELDAAKHKQALDGLRRINYWSDSSVKIAKAASQLNSLSGPLGPTKPIRLLDLGCGGGDVTSGVFNYFCKSGQAVQIEGWDMSSTAVELASKRHARLNPGSNSIEFRVQNVFDIADRETKFDIVFCSLFMHHFNDGQVVTLLQQMRGLSTVGVIVDDLLRTRLGHLLAVFGCHVLSRSPIVHFDGPQSVRAAYRIEEFDQLANEAGLSDASFRCHWPQRFLMAWSSSSNS